MAEVSPKSNTFNFQKPEWVAKVDFPWASEGNLPAATGQVQGAEIPAACESVQVLSMLPIVDAAVPEPLKNFKLSLLVPSFHWPTGPVPSVPHFVPSEVLANEGAWFSNGTGFFMDWYAMLY